MCVFCVSASGVQNLMWAVACGVYFSNLLSTVVYCITGNISRPYRFGGLAQTGRRKDIGES